MWPPWPPLLALEPWIPMKCLLCPATPPTPPLDLRPEPQGGLNLAPEELYVAVPAATTTASLTKSRTRSTSASSRPASVRSVPASREYGVWQGEGSGPPLKVTDFRPAIPHFREHCSILPAESALKSQRGPRRKRHLTEGRIRSGTTSRKAHSHVNKLAIEAGVRSEYLWPGRESEFWV